MLSSANLSEWKTPSESDTVDLSSAVAAKKASRPSPTPTIFSGGKLTDEPTKKIIVA
jgi:hypothetical protein